MKPWKVLKVSTKLGGLLEKDHTYFCSKEGAAQALRWDKIRTQIRNQLKSMHLAKEGTFLTCGMVNQCTKGPGCEQNGLKTDKRGM